MSNQNAPWVASPALSWYYELVREQTRLDDAWARDKRIADQHQAVVHRQGLMCTLLHIRDGIRPILNQYLPDLRILNLIQTNQKGEDELTQAGLSALAEWEAE